MVRADRIVGAAALVAGLVAPAVVSGQAGVSVAVADVSADAVFRALGKECYDAGMLAEQPSDSVLDCSVVLEERSTGDAGSDADDPSEAAGNVIVRHRLRFTVLERAAGLSVAADAWTETEELGIAVDQPLTSEEYLERIRDVVVDVGGRLRESQGATPPWSPRYESEQAWHLEAHLGAVRHCDANLVSMSAGEAGELLESIGVRPLSDAARDRCEQLFQHVFEWGLARGDAEPTVAEYVRYREALPPEQRTCTGRLALGSPCS